MVEERWDPGLGVRAGGGFLTGTLDSCGLTPPAPAPSSPASSSVLPQLCLSLSNLVQGLNVHLGTLIGKTWQPGGGDWGL